MVIVEQGGTLYMCRELYLGGDYEDVRPPAGTSPYDIIQHIQVTDVVRQVRRRVEATQAWEVLYEYVHRDHLGSVDAITNSAGVVQAKFSFDPFGGRRAQTWNGDLDATGLAALLAWQDNRGSRGFTNHEHLNRTGFVHMNGRVYDPRIGRFVSPDPVVQLPTFSQSYNRYSYALNNPLSYTDPSGFFVKKLFNKAKKGVKSFFKGVAKFIKQYAVDIAIGVITIVRPELGKVLIRARAAQRTASATMRRSRAGPEARGGGAPGIAGPVTVFGMEQSPSRASVRAPELPPVLAPHANAVISILVGLDVGTPEGRYVLAAILVLLNEWPLPQSGFSVIRGGERS
jgi:RHS repeat-associated protein